MFFNLCAVVILILSGEFHSVSGDVFYIVTTQDGPCPGEFVGVPCLTLQQYASNPSQSQNITFLVEPGTYNLSTMLTVSNGYNFTLSSNNATVICTSSTAGFSFNAVDYIHISGVIFQGCTIAATRLVSVSLYNGVAPTASGFSFDTAENVRIVGVTFQQSRYTVLSMSLTGVTQEEIL